jgi:hypothetical protein
VSGEYDPPPGSRISREVWAEIYIKQAEEGVAAAIRSQNNVAAAYTFLHSRFTDYLQTTCNRLLAADPGCSEEINRLYDLGLEVLQEVLDLSSEHVHGRLEIAYQQALSWKAEAEAARIALHDGSHQAAPAPASDLPAAEGSTSPPAGQASGTPSGEASGNQTGQGPASPAGQPPTDTTGEAASGSTDGS